METKTLQPDLKAIENLKKSNILISRMMFHTGTPAHGNKNRGVGITRKSKEQSKKARKTSKQSRKINRGR